MSSIFNSLNKAEQYHISTDANMPLNIALIGDFFPGSPQYKIYNIDIDTFHNLLSKNPLEIYLDLTGEEEKTRFVISELDDFSPDVLVEHSFFQKLIEKKKSPPSSNQEVKNTLEKSNNNEKPSANVLDDILSLSEETSPLDDWQKGIQALINPFTVPSAKQSEIEWAEKIDEAACQVMRRVLHHPIFQHYESIWKGLFFLLKRTHRSHNVKIKLIQCSKKEFIKDLNESPDLDQSLLCQTLHKSQIEKLHGNGWGTLVGLFDFSLEKEDIKALGNISKIAEAFSSPFIASAHSQFFGCQDYIKTPTPSEWTINHENFPKDMVSDLRNLDSASWLGLIAPRFMLRTPYGKKGEQLDYFDFEEIPSGDLHESYLWGNSSLLALILIIENYDHYGWDARIGMFKDVMDLPVHFFKQYGEKEMKPCSETYFTDYSVEHIIKHGIIPVISFLGEDRVVIPKFNSFSAHNTPLYGRWTE